MPGAGLTLELMQYHYPVGRKEPIVFAANDVSGARHLALKITNIDEAFEHIKAMSDTKLINQTDSYKVYTISDTKPQEVLFPGQNPGEADERNENAAAILSRVRYFFLLINTDFNGNLSRDIPISVINNYDL